MAAEKVPQKLSVHLYVPGQSDSAGRPIEVNAPAGTSFEGCGFRGQVLFLNRPDPEPADWRYAEHFKDKNRRYEFRLQGMFTADPGTGEDVFFGIEFPGKVGLSWAMKATAEWVLHWIRTLCAGRGIGYSYNLELLEGQNGDVVLPYLAFPLVAADAIVVTPPGEKAPKLTEPFEAVSLQQKSAIRLNTTDTFTFTYWSKQADFERWEMTNMPLGWSTSFCTFIGSLPVHFVCYRLRGGSRHKGYHWESQKRPFFRMVLTNTLSEDPSLVAAAEEEAELLACCSAEQVAIQTRDHGWLSCVACCSWRQYG